MVTPNTPFPVRDRDVVTYAQFDGLRNDTDPERFELGDLAVADNVSIDKTGRLERRRGYTSVLGLAVHSMWADEVQENCLFVSGALRRFDGAASTVLTSLRDTASRMAYARVSDRIYFLNGTDKGVLEGGAVRTWGLPVAPLPSVAASVGNMPAGNYQYVMTWLRSDGQESGCSIAGQIELGAGSGMAFSLPTVPQADVVARTLYISPPNGDALYEAVVVPASQTSLNWGGDPTRLSMPLATQFCGPPPDGHLVAHYRGHMFVAVQDTIFISERFGYELFSLRRYLQLDGRITMLAPFTEKESTDTGRGSGFFVGTDRSIGVIAGSDPDGFIYVPKVDYGAVEGTVQYIDGSLLRDGGSGARKLPTWLSERGICVGMPDLQVVNLTRSRFEFAAGGQGASIFLPDPNRLIVTPNL